MSSHLPPHLPTLPPDSLGFALARAAEVIASVIKGRNLDAALAAASIPAPARPAVQDLAYSTLRQFGRGEFLLGRLLRAPLKDATVHALLLAAVARLEARPAEAHTTVDQAVHAASTLAGGRFKPVVNGVLRNFLRQQAELVAEIAGDEVALWQHPAWWIALVQRSHPLHWREVLSAANQRPPLTLRVNRRRTTRDSYLQALLNVGIAARGLAEVETAIQLERPVGVEHLPGFADGLVSVQDAAAQWTPRLLDLRPGLRVLDACAAPGGKAAHLLESEDIELLALEADARRSQRIHENLQRLGLSAQVKVADCRKVATWWDGRGFDRILADVPCSASGVVRRHPDAKWLRRPEDVTSFATLQAEIIEALWPALTPGGRMLYCTCSVFPAENQSQIEAFVARHADARRLPTAPDGAPDLQLLPDAEHDGLYYALLEKIG